jgi:hypothetical protein
MPFQGEQAIRDLGFGGQLHEVFGKSLMLADGRQ